MTERRSEVFIRAALYPALVLGLIVALPASAGKPPFPNELKYPNIIEPISSFGTYGSNPGQMIDPLGVDFGPDGRIYIIDSGNARVQVFREDGTPLALWGTNGTAAGEFVSPEDLSVNSAGLVFVADTGNHRVQAFDAEGKFVRMWGSHGNAPGQFRMPRGIIAIADRVYVADTDNQRVQVFDLEGELVHHFGRFGEGPGEFNQPVSIAVDEAGSVYVSDHYNNRIQKFSPDGEFLTAWGKWGSHSGLMATPAHIAYGDGELYLADLINHRIQVFDRQGKFLYQFGRHPNTPHEGNGRLHYPMTLASSPVSGNVVVCEPFENRCQTFGRSSIETVAVRNVDDSAWWDKATRFHYGTTAATISSYLMVGEPDTHAVLLFDISEGQPQLIRRFGGEGTEPGRFKSPEGVAIDPVNERLFVADLGNSRVQVFSLQKGLEGSLLSTFGSRGSQPAHFDKPGAMTMDSVGNLYVLDVGNGRIQVFDQNLNFVTAWGKVGSGEGEFNVPTAIALSPDEERIYVLDSYNYRVQVLDRSGNFISSFGGPGAGDSQFIWPYGMDVDDQGYVYVSDAGGQKVKKFTSDGKFVAAFGSFGSGPGEFYKPKGVAVSDQGVLYVIDFGNHRGQMLTRDGEFIAEWGIGELSGSTPPDNGPLVLRSALGGVGALLLLGGVIGLRRTRRLRKA